MESALLPTPRLARTRVLRYLAGRLLILATTVVLGVYITLVIANLGGYADQTVRHNIDSVLEARIYAGWLRGETPEDRVRIYDETRLALYDAAGLNRPFLLRTFIWLGRGLTLDWGPSGAGFLFGDRYMAVREVILKALPRTLLLFGTSNLFLFFTSVALGLWLSRKPDGVASRLLAALTPLSSIPPWAYAFLLMYVTMTFLGIYWARTVVSWPEDWSSPAGLAFILMQLTIPFLALLLSKIFQGVYVWQTIFLLNADEQYVELARAKGLSPQLIERRYLVRPALPVILTSFALIMLGIWQESVPLEYFFNISGIGSLLLFSLNRVDIGTLLGLVVTFSYLLAVTMFLLDIVRILIDPRASLPGQNEVRCALVARAARGRRAWRPDLSRLRPDPGRMLAGIRRNLTSLGSFARLFARQRAGMVGLAVILLMVALSIYTPIALPAEVAFDRWRDTSGWQQKPRNAVPAWFNLLRREPLPETIIIMNADPAVTRERVEINPGMWQITLRLPFDVAAGEFPQDVSVRLSSSFDQKVPLVSLSWSTPDGRTVDLDTRTLNASEVIFTFSQQPELKTRLRSNEPEVLLFTDPNSQTEALLPGRYELIVTAFVFEPQADLQADLCVYGRVFGLAGTDERRRDLSIPMLWGTPIALIFGLLAALGTSLVSLSFAAAGAWLGGWVDWTVQRLTEINMILPFLPVCMMVFVLYSNTVWAILGTAVALSVFGNSVLVYRSILLQVREAGYIEAALAYGVSDRRIILRYLIPRVLPTLIPQLIILVPSFVFFEAMMGAMGMSDPRMPTWGLLLRDTLVNGLVGRPTFQMVAPLVLLLLLGLSFAAVGVALNRVMNPQLRET